MTTLKDTAEKNETNHVIQLNLHIPDPSPTGASCVLVNHQTGEVFTMQQFMVVGFNGENSMAVLAAKQDDLDKGMQILANEISAQNTKASRIILPNEQKLDMGASPLHSHDNVNVQLIRKKN